MNRQELIKTSVYCKKLNKKDCYEQLLQIGELLPDEQLYNLAQVLAHFQPSPGQKAKNIYELLIKAVDNSEEVITKKNCFVIKGGKAMVITPQSMIITQTDMDDGVYHWPDMEKIKNIDEVKLPRLDAVTSLEREETKLVLDTFEDAPCFTAENQKFPYKQIAYLQKNLELIAHYHTQEARPLVVQGNFKGQRVTAYIMPYTT